MTSSWKVFGQLLGSRIRKMSQLVGTYLIVVLISGVMWGIQTISAMDLQAIAVIFDAILMVVVIVMLAQDQERVWISDRWRLIPIADWKLYSLSTLANLVATVYEWLLTGAIMFGTFVISHTNEGNWKFGNPSIAFTMACLVFAGLLFAWSLISLVHMLTLMISSFLPDMRQKVLRVGLTVVVVLIAIKLVNWLFNALSWFIGLLGFKAGAWFDITGHMTVRMYGQLWSSIGMIVVASLIIGGVCCYLLGHWVETKQVQSVA